MRKDLDAVFYFQPSLPLPQWEAGIYCCDFFISVWLGPLTFVAWLGWRNLNQQPPII